MKQLILVISFIFSSQVLLLSQSSMEVNDPQSWWERSPGQVENVDIQIKPIGLYSEVQIAFDVVVTSVENFQPEDQLEFVIQFQMPEDVVFNDSWLWINSYISEGEIYEVNEGTQIYEDIVDRRQDPSILTKHSSTDYSLRIYPLKHDSTRRVMLSYVSPLNFEVREAQIDLPLSIISSSFAPPENVNLKIIDTQNWSHLEPNDDTFLYTGSTGTEHNYKMKEASVLALNSITYMPDDISKPFYFGSYTSANENYYQLAYFPEIEIVNPDKRTMIVLDHDTRNANNDVTIEEMLSLIEAQLIDNLKDTDYFNICYSNFITEFASDQWILATRSNIEMAMSFLRNNDIDELSSLTTLLPEALNFINELGFSADIKVLSANTEVNSLSDANAFYKEISDFIETMTSQVSISILNFARFNQAGYWVGNQYFIGNQYFYLLLSGLSNTKYFHGRYLYEIRNYIKQLFEGDEILISEYDFDFDASNGFAYSNYLNLSQGHYINLDQPIIATGKYVGDYPFNIEFQGFYNGEIFNETFLIERGEDINITFQAEQVWHANYILENEFTNNNAISAEVIDVSKEQNLLSAKTIFLCLEPDTSSISSNNLSNEDGDEVLISTEEVALNNSIKIFPNPFVDNLTVKIPISENLGTKEMQLKLINTKGQLIATQFVNPTVVGDYYQLNWDIDFELLSGMYIIEIIADNFVAHKNIIHLK